MCSPAGRNAILEDEWSFDTHVRFLECYGNEPVIWNPDHPNKTKKKDVHEAWIRLSQAMDNTPIPLLKKKRDSLMATFRGHFRKKKASIKAGASEDDIYTPRWQYYSIMERIFAGSVYDVDSVNIERQSPPLHHFLDSSQIKQEKPSGSNGTPNTKYPRKRKIEVRREETAREDTEQYGECELYCKLLAKKMRKLDERQRDIAMHEIDNIMFLVKMNCIPHSQHSNYGSTNNFKNTTPESSVFIVTNEQNDQYKEEYLEDPMQET
ncbi:alcohol dehydrogenase transcription factor myb/SANT-like domain-containing protein [Phthorimaea operculella]|nr:alcohol dehydrogenase transcription factor myb/SANT-like domain-containing protein [Phthorimaea operculella]